MVSVGEPVRPGPRGADDRLLLERESRLVRSDEREQLGDRAGALRVGDGVARSLGDA